MRICTRCRQKNKRRDIICEICAALDEVRRLEEFQEEWNRNLRRQSKREEQAAIRRV